MDDDDRPLAEQQLQEQFMSVVACVDCGSFIDTDEEPECFDRYDRPFCAQCREEQVEENEDAE